MLKPKQLQTGDTVGIIAPAGPPVRKNVEKGIQFLRACGLQVKLGKSIYKEHGYLAGRDEERLDDLHEMFHDQTVKAIFCARGGYGSARLAPNIDYRLIRENPKVFWGYSDITFLHLAILQKAGVVSFHGPMIASDLGQNEVSPVTKQSFYQLFHPKPLEITADHSPFETISEGVAVGSLIGGNLSLITSTLGTPFEINTKGKILLIEEINEEPRVVDRMLNQLEMAGKLAATAGIMIGDFHGCEPKTTQSFTINEVLKCYLERAGRPAITGLSIGHCSPNQAVPFGVLAILDTKKGQLKIESGVMRS